MTPGMQVSVVNSYEATSDSVPVIFVKREDFPTEGNLENKIYETKVNERNREKMK